MEGVQATTAVTYLQNVSLMGTTLRLHIKNEFVNASFKSIDYSASSLQRYSPKRIWARAKMFGPTRTLVLYNVGRNVLNEEVLDAFSREGFTVYQITSPPCGDTYSKIMFCSFRDIQEAVDALCVMHTTEHSAGKRERGVRGIAGKGAFRARAEGPCLLSRAALAPRHGKARPVALSPCTVHL